MNSIKMLNKYNFSKSQTFSSLTSNTNPNTNNNEEDINDIRRFKPNKLSRSTNLVTLPKNFVPVIRPKKKISQILTPLFLNPTQELNNSYEKNDDSENFSMSSDSEIYEDEKENFYAKNNDFYDIEVIYKIEDKVSENTDDENKVEEKKKNYPKYVKKNSLIENKSFSKLRKTMKNIYSKSEQKKYFKCCEDGLNCNLKLNFDDNDLALNTNNVNFNNNFNNEDLRPQKYFSFCNPKNVSILSVLKKSM